MRVRVIKVNNPLYCAGNIYTVVNEEEHHYKIQLPVGIRNIRKEDCKKSLWL